MEKEDEARWKVLHPIQFCIDFNEKLGVNGGGGLRFRILPNSNFRTIGYCHLNSFCLSSNYVEIHRVEGPQLHCILPDCSVRMAQHGARGEKGGGKFKFLEVNRRYLPVAEFVYA